MKIELRKWTLDYADELYPLVNNKNVQDNLRDGMPYPYSKEDALEYIEGNIKSSDDDVFAWAIFADGSLAGSIGIFRKNNIHYRTAELGYYLGEEFWGLGIMTAAVKEACRRVFEESDIIRIFAEPFANNQGSIKVLKKAGFEYEGRMRKNAVKNGVIIDMELFSLIKD